ncbi:hypothetical protein P175DRAFT_0516827 [Aspergillus ochraceoroseus IBT 24754]|uniref:RTA1 domain protein n=1 Tax=Aspergillus ochraceoroseus IBT 24754 TaxID=1392256 RepID=A0A2T5LTZ8_9EURO|nr:uncharacterized protein P175DRAFT_0516827 [Aspergillus ochraceoroseus IBT 24754]PTU19748.1 hypothetical protein P175DRAFT_0516827 [Aspergillus ochraceoroseus IBT 24754]
MVSGLDPETGAYGYKPSHVLPIVFAVVMSVSLISHTYQNFHYRFWRVTFFMCWGGLIYVTGWILRAISSHHPTNVNLYIAQYIFIYAGPPVYSAAAYNLLGRIMNYIPMFAWLNPNRTTYFFVYIGALVEALTAAGAARAATSSRDPDMYQSGMTLVGIAVVLQCVIEGILVGVVAMLHRRCHKARMVPPNLRILFYTLYGTSALVMVRCIFRAIESMNTTSRDSCNDICAAVYGKEWLLYAFDAAPMVVFTFWVNLLHPGRSLPRDKKQYLDTDGMSERMGPGWIDKRSTVETFIDPLDLTGLISGQKSHMKFWLEPEQWPVCEDSFAGRTASSVAGRSSRSPKERGLDLEVVTA